MTWPQVEPDLPCQPQLHNEDPNRRATVSSFQWRGASEDGRVAALELWSGMPLEYVVDYQADSREAAEERAELTVDVEQLPWCRDDDTIFVQHREQTHKLVWRTFKEACGNQEGESLQWEVCTREESPKCARPTHYCADEGVELVDLFAAKDVLWVVGERNQRRTIRRFAGGATGILTAAR